MFVKSRSMKHFGFNFGKFFKLIPGGIFGLFSVAMGIGGNIISFLLFPGYNFTKNMVSDLGIGPDGIFFNLGLIISGITAIPFNIQLGRDFLSKNINEYLRKSAVIISIISSVSMSLIGCFPAMVENRIIFFLHGIFAVISFIGGFIYVALFSSLMLKNPKFSIHYVIFGFIIAAAFLIFLITGLPITEWIAVYAICLWAIINSIKMLRNKI